MHEIVDREVVGQWDHRDLNEVLDNPTAELLAHRAWELLTDAGVTLPPSACGRPTTSWVELTASDRTPDHER